MLTKLVKFLKHPSSIIIFLNNRNIPILSDEAYLQLRYKLTFGKKLNINNPKTFSEKLQWLKLYDRNPKYSIMVDKYEVKNYVENIIGKEYIIPTIAVYNNYDEIDFESLPNQFVMKCTHDSGGLVVCQNKATLDKTAALKKIKKSFNKNYFYGGREWPYKNLKPKIIVEKYMTDKLNKDLIDYKFFCFNGIPKYILVCTDRSTDLKETFYDTNWNLALFKRPNHDIDETINKPKNFKKMLELASKLASNIPFVRVDFYEINGQIYFGELTFFPASGMSKFSPEIWDEKLGNLLDISMVDKIWERKKPFIMF